MSREEMGRFGVLGVILLISSWGQAFPVSDVPGPSVRLPAETGPVRMASIEPASRLEIGVLVHNYTSLDDRGLAEAEAEATAILQDALIEPRWMNCGTAGGRQTEESGCSRAFAPQSLFINVTSRPSGPKFGREGTVLGFAQLDTGGNWPAYATVFYDSTREVARESGIAPADVLGCLLARQVGQLLMGGSDVPKLGIMRDSWGREDLARLARGRLRFTRAQHGLLRAGVLARRNDFEANGSLLRTGFEPQGSCGAGDEEPPPVRPNPLMRLLCRWSHAAKKLPCLSKTTREMLVASLLESFNLRFGTSVRRSQVAVIDRKTDHLEVVLPDGAIMPHKPVRPTGRPARRLHPRYSREIRYWSNVPGPGKAVHILYDPELNAQGQLKVGPEIHADRTSARGLTAILGHFAEDLITTQFASRCQGRCAVK